MKKLLMACGSLWVFASLLALSMPGAVHGAQTAANFDADPGWVGVNNTIGNNKFGWSDTNRVGTARGEIGGVFDRVKTSMSAYYAVPVTGLSADTPLSARGRFGWDEEGGRTSGEWNVGWFNANYPKTESQPRFAIAFAFNSRNHTVRAYHPKADFVGGQWRAWRGKDLEPSKIPSLTGCGLSGPCAGPKGGKTFNFTYDPNADSGGRVTMTVTADDGTTYTLTDGHFSLNPGEKALIGSFSHFGIFNTNDLPNGGVERQSRMWIDNLTFTSSADRAAMRSNRNSSYSTDVINHVIRGISFLPERLGRNPANHHWSRIPFRGLSITATGKCVPVLVPKH